MYKKLITIVALMLISISIVGCSEKNKKNELIIGASSVPHAEILNHIKPKLKKEGIDLEVKVFNDFVLPNAALDAGELDANYYQHKPYLKKSNKDNGYKLVSAGAIHLEPLGIYSKRVKKITDLKDNATVLVSNSQADWGRVLTILQKNKLITIKPNVNIETATFKDIKNNPKHLKFKHSFDPKLLPELLDNNEGDLVAINSNYAVQAQIKPSSAIAVESTDSPYSNIVAVKKNHQNDYKIKKLVQALHAQDTQKWILKRWHGAILPVK